MSRSNLLIFLPAVSLLLISAILISRRYTVTKRSAEPSLVRNLKKSFGDRSTKKAQHVENLQTSWGSVRAKKMPLSSDTRKHDYSLKVDHREEGEPKRSYRIEENPKGRAGKREGKGKQGGGKTKSSKRGKGGKKKKKKSKSECTFGKGKGKSKSELSSSFEFNCEDFNFPGASSTSLSVPNPGALGGCGPNVLDQALSLPELSTFVQLIAMADLSCMFHCGGPFTLLAPTNAAFESLNPEAMVELLRPENQVFLQELILENILPGLHLSSDINQNSIDSLMGESVRVEGDPLSFAGIDVQTPDIVGCNGVLHILGGVLIPSSGKFKTKGTAVIQTSHLLSNLETRAPVSVDQATQFPTPGRQPDAPVAAPIAADLTEVPTVIALNPPEPPVAPPVASPVAPPMNSPVGPPINPPIPVAPPVTPSATPPVAPSEVVTSAPTSEVTARTETPTALVIETLLPTESPFVRVDTRDVFLALVAPSASASPRRSEFESLAQLTTSYFDEYLRAFFADDPDVTFVRVESKLSVAKYGITIVYEDGSNPPNAAETVDLLKASISVDYILNIPRMMTGTPFASTNEAYLSTL